MEHHAGLPLSVRQPDFFAASAGLRQVADEMDLCGNIPAFNAGSQILEEIRLLRELMTRVSEKVDRMDDRMTAMGLRMTAMYAIRNNWLFFSFVSA